MSAAGPRARRLTHRLLDVVFPPHCVACRKAGAWYCARCLTQLPREPLTLCARCVQPLAPSTLRCPVCRAPSPSSLVSVTTWGVYGAALKQGVFALKYQRRQAIAPLLADLLTPFLSVLCRPGDIIVPVPLHPRRERERGYNQTAILARALADGLALAGCPGVRVRSDLLRRTKATADQTLLGPDDRRRNMANAFAAAPMPSWPSGTRLWLCDDVVTTGATLHACAVALRDQGGSAPVHGLALARAAIGLLPYYKVSGA